MAIRIPYELISHTRKICSLYKRWVRNLEVIYEDRGEFRYEATLARSRFDKLLHEKDMMKAKVMIEDWEEELFQNLDPQQLYFPTSPGGVAYGRGSIPPDFVIDYWHPLEKAAYPKYFQRRELRKQQFVEMWERNYGECSKSKTGKK